jgi:HlyD family secretion protein
MDTTRQLQHRSTRLRWAVAGAVALVLALGTWWLTRGGAAAQIAPVPVQSGPLADTVPINAVLTPSRLGVVATVSGGTITEVVAFPGQKVKEGDVLARLSNPDLERQLAEAVSEQAGANSDLVSVRADSVGQASALRMEEINAANAVRIADMQLQAESKLQQQGIISRLTLDKTTAEREGKLAAHDYARVHAAQARTASAAKIVAAAERVAVLKARADSLRTLVDGLTLRAPFDGVVSKIDGKPGAAIAGGTQVAEVITADLQINLEVAEQFADAIHVGQAIRLPGGIHGKIVALAPSADGGIVKGRAQIEGDTSKLRPNSTLPGEAVLTEHGTGLYVELDGAGLANKEVVATVQSGGSTSSRTVRFGPRYRQQLVVLAGAAAGDQIVALDVDSAQ